MLWIWIPLRRGVLDSTLCDKSLSLTWGKLEVSLGTVVSSTNKTDHHDKTEILLKVALKPHNPNPSSHNYTSNILHDNSRYG